MPWLRPHRRFRDRLSAYIDGRLEQRDREDLDRHLVACPDCRRDLSELRATVQALQDLPQAEAPRSFALTPGHLERPAPAAPPRPAPGLMTGLRLAAAALTVALVAVVFVDLGGVADDETADRAARSGESAQPAESQFGAEPYDTGTPGAEDSGTAPASGGHDEPPPEPAAQPAATATPGPDTPVSRDTDDAGQPNDDTALAPAPTTPPGAEPAAASEAAPAEDGGFDALLVAEIALAVALAAVVAAAMGFTCAGRKG